MVTVAAAGVDRVLPVEDDVVGREWLAVVPADPALELPDDAATVRGDPAVFAAGDLGREHGLEVGVNIPLNQWLVKDPGSKHILGAGCEVRVEQRRRVRSEHAQRAAAAAASRFVTGGLRRRDAGLHQHDAAHRYC